MAMLQRETMSSVATMSPARSRWPLAPSFVIFGIIQSIWSNCTMTKNIDLLLARMHDFAESIQSGWALSSGPDSEKFNKGWGGGFAKNRLYRSMLSLVANSERMHAQVDFPILMFNYGRRFQEIFSVVCAKHGYPPLDQAQGFPPFEELFTKWITGEVDIPTRMGGLTGYRHVSGVVAFDGDRSARAAEAFNSVLVIQGWSVFENLCEDLWEDALNSHPVQLSMLLGKPRSKHGRDKKDSQKQVQKADKENSQKQFPLWELQNNNFNTRNCMGTILKSRFGFRSLPDIREAYHLAFSEGYEEVDKVLDDDRLQYAAAVRNVLVHKAGNVDAEFKQQTANIADVVEVKEGSPFPLSGALAKHLSDATISCAVSLLVRVSDWIDAHPEKDL